ncbi:MAG: diguanylate cyclase, partial [Leptothrix ochracea]|uniref:diguanylate cyclase n=2 Tax=Leptothrix ochracea TaxID=735331 RepID=UPI0034E22517
RPNTQPPITMTRDKGLRLARRIYLPRCIGLGLGAFCVAAGMHQHGVPGWAWVVLGLHALVWPHAAYQWSIHHPEPLLCERRNLWLDAAAGGFWVPMMGFNVLPSVLILTMLSMDNIATGGPRFFGRGLIASALGIGLGCGVAGIDVQLGSNLATILACLPFMVIFPITIGVVTYRTATQLGQRKRELYWLGQHDALSGLWTRAYLERHMDEALLAFNQSGQTATLVMADVDHFKHINDAMGHLVGDEAIQSLGDVLRTQTRQSDIPARLGGDEFCLLLPRTGLDAALALIGRIQGALAQRPMPISMSYGVVTLSADIHSRRQWLARTDRMLYAVKRSGRGKVQVYTAAESPASAASAPSAASA